MEKCLLRGTDWVFKLSSLRFVFKGLKLVVFSGVTLCHPLDGLYFEQLTAYLNIV
jgi:hypothetical protein